MNHNHSSSGTQANHVLLMLLCCLIPIALIAGVAIFGFSLSALAPYLPFVLVLLCPLMMFLLMREMGHDHRPGDAQHIDTRHIAPTRQIQAPPPDAVKPNAAPRER